MGGCISSHDSGANEERSSSPRRVQQGGAVGNDQNAASPVPTGGNRPLLPRSQLDYKPDTPMTLRQFLRKRDEFWDTMPSYSGLAQVWQALRAACEAPTLELAQAIVDSANMTVPTGRLTDGCYDERGNMYTIPAFCIVDPTRVRGLLPPERDEDAEGDHADDDDGEGADGATITDGGITGTSGASDIKGKRLSKSSKRSSTTSPHPPHQPPALDPTAPTLTLTARLSTGKDVKLQTTAATTVRDMRAMVAGVVGEESSTTTAKGGKPGKPPKLKFFYLGRLLEDGASVKGLELGEGSVVQVMIVPSL
ncbi:uncharacterized protein EV422DRAFT_507505 [Fimicolochytrium jonesii]|uniref:uncharacterized protein n=1 Tax=Fimicolochytrium jonesii TaxID=1396493 RepID=UPI0022FF39C7|nr:uncharacterized protein EV422DRAFT_507505 [Fimicolochytrium jonesii]KAI8819446.1 hypothetical protein EV422DRAFT_507505 [Fimicolochytrium jonesii]